MGIKLKGKNWAIIKTIIVNWTIFALIVSTYVMLVLLRTNKEVEQRLQICQHNMEEITKQIKYGRIILELEDKEK